MNSGQWIKRLRNFARRPRWSSVRFWLGRALPQPSTYLYHVIWKDPIILTAWDYPAFLNVLRVLRGHETQVFLTITGSVEYADKLAELRSFQDWTRRFPEHRVICMANSRREKDVLDRENIPAILCNHNCFLDERLFDVMQHEPKRFRAIYDARLSPFKRHELAVKVEGLALVTYVSAQGHDEEYVRRIGRELSGATWLNGPFAREYSVMLKEAEVCRVVNQSRCGLILSSVEGGNFASGQYLLCGVPVVTTRSQGGRDALFHPDYVVTVEDNPDAVAAGADELIRRNLDPRVIRERTLALIREHRRHFLEEVGKIFASRGPAPDLEAEWTRFFIHKMVQSQGLGEARRLARQRHG